jgi:hypothetical protein
VQRYGILHVLASFWPFFKRRAMREEAKGELQQEFERLRLSFSGGAATELPSSLLALPSSLKYTFGIK